MRITTNRIIFALFAIAAVLYGGAKSAGQGVISFLYTDREHQYIFDRGSDFLDGDIIHIDFTVSPVLPASAEIEAWYRPVGSTNDADWVELWSSTVGMLVLPVNTYLEGATTNNVIVFTTWVPPPTAHTNGVAMIEWRKAALDVIVPFRTGIYADDERLAPDPAMTNNIENLLLGVENHDN